MKLTFECLFRNLRSNCALKKVRSQRSEVGSQIERPGRAITAHSRSFSALSLILTSAICLLQSYFKTIRKKKYESVLYIRILQIKNNANLGKLHDYIQGVMRRKDCHLHEFKIKGKNYQRLKFTCTKPLMIP